jgi:hypothetical protein
MAEQKKIMFVDRSLDLFTNDANKSTADLFIARLEEFCPNKFVIKRIQVSSDGKAPQGEYAYTNCNVLPEQLAAICKGNGWALDRVFYVGRIGAYDEQSSPDGFKENAWKKLGFADSQMTAVHDLIEEPNLETMDDYLDSLRFLLETTGTDTKKPALIEKDEKKEEKKDEKKDEKKTPDMDEKPLTDFFATLPAVSAQTDEKTMFIMTAKGEAETAFTQAISDHKSSNDVLALLGARVAYLQWMFDRLIKGKSSDLKQDEADKKITEIAKGGVVLKTDANGKVTASIPENDTEQKNVISFSVEAFKNESIKKLHEQIFPKGNTVAVEHTI